MWYTSVPLAAAIQKLVGDADADADVLAAVAVALPLPLPVNGFLPVSVAALLGQVSESHAVSSNFVAVVFLLGPYSQAECFVDGLFKGS